MGLRMSDQVEEIRRRYRFRSEYARDIGLLLARIDHIESLVWESHHSTGIKPNAMASAYCSYLGSWNGEGEYERGIHLGASPCPTCRSHFERVYGEEEG